MSIYCTRTWIGEEPGEPHERGAGRVITYPDNDLSQVKDGWPPAIVHTDHIPAWCDWPRGSYGEFEEVAPWLRLGICDNGTTLAVLIDEKAARTLAADLNAWARLPKTRWLS